jgi:hypothetical protein
LALADACRVRTDPGVTEEHDVSSGKPATMWFGAFNGGYFSPEAAQWEQIWDARGARPAWLSPLMDGEENLRAVGAVRRNDRWELHAWQADEKWFALDRGSQLYVHGKPSAVSILTSSTEASVFVAGDISERSDGSGGTPQVWGIADEEGFDGGRWTRLSLASRPDALTDIAQWDLGLWVAGHRHLRPVIYDHDDGEEGEVLAADPGTWRQAHGGPDGQGWRLPAHCWRTLVPADARQPMLSAPAFPRRPRMNL